MTRPRLSPTAWQAYLSTFHQERPGITEDVLASATSAGQNPYQWLLELIPRDATLLDLACGNAPLLAAGWAGHWVGVDRSPAELERARANGAHAIVAADADHLPFGDHSFTAVVCSMGLMLLEPLGDCLAEIARVLAPGGIVALLLPGGATALTTRDLWRWARLLVALRRTHLAYPNDRAMRRLAATVHRCGLIIVADERRRFAAPIQTGAVAARFVDSLYLPGINGARAQAARRLASTWDSHAIGIPLRRVLLKAAGEGI